MGTMPETMAEKLPETLFRLLGYAFDYGSSPHFPCDGVLKPPGFDRNGLVSPKCYSQ
jgi:hypothetical protein